MNATSKHEITVFFDLLSKRVGTDPLHHIAMMEGMNRKEADSLLKQATLIKAMPGDRIIRQDEVDETLYILLSGIADAIHDDRPDRPVAVIGAGDPFGEIGFLNSVPRTTSVIARSRCELLVLSADALHRFINKEPEISAKLLLNLSKIMASRLALTTSRVASGLL